MSAEVPSEPGTGWVPPAPGDALRQVVDALERWGELFLRVADEAAIRTIVGRTQALAVPDPTPNPKGDP